MEVQDYLDKAMEQADNCKIPYRDFDVYFMKSSRTYGRCVRSYDTDTGEEVFEVLLNEYVLSCSEKTIMETLLHELIHTCEDCFNHGKVFKMYCDRLNKKYGYNCKRTIDEVLKVPNVYHYKVTCLGCKAEMFYARRPKIADHLKGEYRCRKCGYKEFKFEEV